MVRFYHGFLNGLLMTFPGYETTQWNAWLYLPELESSYILAPWPLSLTQKASEHSESGQGTRLESSGSAHSS